MKRPSTSPCTSSDRPARSANSPGKVRPVALGAVRGRPIGQPSRQPRLPRLSRAQGPRALAHPRDTHDRPQTRPPLLPHPQSARPRRARPSRPPLRSSPPITDALKACGQLQQRSRHPRPAWRPTKDRAAAVAPPKRPINHQVTGRQRSRPRAQISKGVHGATHTPSGQHPPSIHDRRATTSHTHPPPQAPTSGGLDTRTPAQISDRGAAAADASLWAEARAARTCRRPLGGCVRRSSLRCRDGPPTRNLQRRCAAYEDRVPAGRRVRYQRRCAPAPSR